MKYVECGCKSPGCVLAIYGDRADQMVYVSFQTHARTWRQRIKLAWLALSNGKVGWSEIVLCRENAFALIEAISNPPEL
jgi:hypothetical protein